MTSTLPDGTTITYTSAGHPPTPSTSVASFDPALPFGRQQ